jgi:hypothetical protein
MHTCHTIAGYDAVNHLYECLQPYQLAPRSARASFGPGQLPVPPLLVVVRWQAETPLSL